VKKVKIKGNTYAELVADVLPNGDFYLGVNERLRPTEYGQLFMGLLREAIHNDKFDTPHKAVNFCYEMTRLAYIKLADDGLLALEVPPQSAVTRKVASFIPPASDD